MGTLLAADPAWWSVRNVTISGRPDQDFAAATIGQLKTFALAARTEMNSRLADQGGAGAAVDAMVNTWLPLQEIPSGEDGSEGEPPKLDFAVANLGQLKAVAKPFYDRLIEVGVVRHYPWSVTIDDDVDFAAANLGQAKHVFNLPFDDWTGSDAETNSDGANAPSFSYSADNPILNAAGLRDAANYHSRLFPRQGGLATNLPAGIETAKNDPVAGVPGEFKSNPDGSAEYTIAFDLPAGAGGLMPALSLRYNSQGGNDIAGMGWGVAGLSTISRGPATAAIDGFTDPPDFDGNDAFYLEGERLILVGGTHGEVGAEYRTEKENYSRARIIPADGEQGVRFAFEVRTKEGTRLLFGSRSQDAKSVAVIGRPGNLAERVMLSWALDKVEDIHGNYYTVNYRRTDPTAIGQNYAPDAIPDYEPDEIQYTGNAAAGIQPPCKVKFHYERRAWDSSISMLHGARLEVFERLKHVEVSSEGLALRTYTIKYKEFPVMSASSSGAPSSTSIATPSVMGSLLAQVVETAGGVATAESMLSSVSHLKQPETRFDWTHQLPAWTRLPENLLDYTGEWLGTTQGRTQLSAAEGAQKASEEQLQLIHSQFGDKSAQFLDVDGDGLTDVLISHLYALNRNRSSYTTNGTVNNSAEGEIKVMRNLGGGKFADVTSTYIPREGAADNAPPDFPWLTTMSGNSTGAVMADLNGDGLPDVMSAGEFSGFTRHWGFVPKPVTIQAVDAKNESLVFLVSKSSTYSGKDHYYYEMKNETWTVRTLSADLKSWVNKSVTVSVPVRKNTKYVCIRKTISVPVPKRISVTGYMQVPGWVYERNQPINNRRGVWLNTGAGWARAPEAYQLPTAAAFPPSPPVTVFNTPSDSGAQTQTNFINENSPRINYPNSEVSGVPVALARHLCQDSGWRVVDLDGDGLADLVRATAPEVGETDEGQYRYAFRNLGPEGGHTWEMRTDGIWKLPISLATHSGRDLFASRLMDVNGDGLPDLIHQSLDNPTAQVNLQSTGSIKVWINEGLDGWREASEYQVPGELLSYSPREIAVDESDAVVLDESGEWIEVGTKKKATKGGIDREFYGRFFMDVNADGLPDFVKAVTEPTNLANLSSTPVTRHKILLNTGAGWSVDQPALHLPLPLQRLKSATDITTYHRGLEDFNGDGKLEFYDAWSGTRNMASGRIWYLTASAGTGTGATALTYRWEERAGLPKEVLSDNPDTTRLRMADMNGDGMLDIMEATTARTAIWHNTALSPKITRITAGLNVPIDIAYGVLPRLARHGKHFRPERLPTGLESALTRWPLVDIVPPTTVCVSHTTNANTPHSTTSTYTYAGHLMHAQRGPLGFASYETGTSKTTVRQRTLFHQYPRELFGSKAWLLAGMPHILQSYYPSGAPEGPVMLLENRTTYGILSLNEGLNSVATDAQTDPQARTYFVYAKSTTAVKQTPDRQDLGTSLVTSGYDDFGNLKSQETRTYASASGQNGQPPGANVGSRVVVQNTFSPPMISATEWRLGQISAAETTQHEAGKASVTKSAEFEYDAKGALESEEAGGHPKVRYYRDLVGNVVKTVVQGDGVPAGQEKISETWYDPSGRFAVAAVNSLGHATTMEYDTARSVVERSSMAFQAAAPTAGPGHSPTPPSPPSGTLFTRHEYDAWGTLKVTTSPSGLRSAKISRRIASDVHPDLVYYVYAQSEGGTPGITYFDRFHRALLSESTAFDGRTIIQASKYDYKGRLVENTLPHFAEEWQTARKTLQEYDIFDRRTAMVSPEGYRTEFRYSGLTTEAVRIVDAVGDTPASELVHTQVSDLQGRTVSAKDPAGNIITYSFTTDGLPDAVTTSYANGSSPPTTINTTYNSRRMKESTTDPNTGTSSTYYDFFGRVSEVRTNDKKAASFSYDVLDRVAEKKTYHLGTEQVETTTVNTYDNAPGFGLGKVASVTFTGGVFSGGPGTSGQVVDSFVYDNKGRVTSTTKTLSGYPKFDGIYTGSVQYEDVQPSSGLYARAYRSTDANGVTVETLFNPQGHAWRTQQAIAGGGTVVLGETLDLDGEGRVLEELKGPHTRVNYVYHPTQGTLQTALTERLGTGGAVVRPLHKMSVVVDPLGNVAQRSETTYDAAGQGSTQTEFFEFDVLNRLTQAVTGNATQNTVYQANGNIQSRTGTGTYTYDATRPHAVASVQGGGGHERSYEYDDQGRMTLERQFVAGAQQPAAGLRMIGYTSFDQPHHILHSSSRELAGEVGSTGLDGSGWNGSVLIRYDFDSSLQRLVETRSKGLMTEYTLHLGGVRRRVVEKAGQEQLEEWRTELGAGAWVWREQASLSAAGYEWHVTDHLGSSTLVLGEDGQAAVGPVAGAAPERHSYDAWGQRRNAVDWSESARAPVGAEAGDGAAATGSGAKGLASSQPRGFTGHQMLDDVGLIHMNGRLYDSFLGRFCSADPYVQSPLNTQNYNRYTYALNNPLSVVDPSGHFFGVIFAIVSVISYIVGAVFTAVSILIAVVMKAIAVIVLAAKALITAAVKFTIGVVKASFGWMKAVGSKLITAVKAGWSQGLSSMTGVKGSTVALGAATNAAWSGIQTARHGGSWKDIFRSAVKGAVIGAIGAVTGAFMHGFGAGAGSLGGGGTSLTGTVMHAAAHGVSAGSMTAANGGSFKDGFIGGAIGFGVGLPFGGTGGMIQGSGPGAIAARTAIAAIGGGVGSKLAGGSFADGAYSAAFFHLFNHEVLEKWRHNVLDAARKNAGKESSPNTEYSFSARYQRRGYTAWGNNTNKCNCFVYYTLMDAGLKPLAYNSAGQLAPPQAGQWADPNVTIWAYTEGAGRGTVIGQWIPTTSPVRGDVIAHGQGGVGYSGHVGIAYYIRNDGIAYISAAHESGAWTSTNDGLNSFIQNRPNLVTYRTFKGN